MNDIEVRIVKLDAMRVAAAHGFGLSPEETAWDKILQFASQKHLLEGAYPPRFFGFNNPNPSTGSPNYGYEQWLVVPAGVQGEADVAIKEFPGGTFAVARLRGLQFIGKAWADLVAWVEASHYDLTDKQCLEELLSPPESIQNPEDMIFDLYLPVEG